MNKEQRLAKIIELARKRAEEKPEVPRPKTAITNRATKRSKVKRKK